MSKRILLIILSVLVVLIGALIFWLRSLLPVYEGELSLKGLKSEVEVYYDNFGIPHIYASNAEDAYFALGYTIAQDRLFQMEMIRRLGGGRLSELAGGSMVKSDRLFRTLNLQGHAEWSAKEFEENAPAEVKSCVAAYLAGVNEYLHNGKTPLEFSLMGIPKEEYTIKDIFLVTGFMAFGFAEGFRIDPVMESMYQSIGDVRMSQLETGWPKGNLTIPVGKKLIAEALDFSAGIDSLLAKFPVSPWIGSNGVVIAPSRSKSGKALLTNDTHMGYMQPAVWYEAHIEYPGFKFYGNYVPGIPFALVGHNEQCGTGLTMLENDDTDFFVEQIEGDSVRYMGELRPLTKRIEKIIVKDSVNFDMEVLETPHGPLVTRIIQEIPVKSGAVSVFWTYLKFPSKALEALYTMNHAGTIREVEQASSLIHAPGLNVMAADHQGNIGWWAAAKLIQRRPGLFSKRFLDGASGKDEYPGYHPFSINPSNVNPPEGFICTANNQPDSTAGLGYYPGYYVPGDRAQRITEIISREKQWDVNSLKRMITDDTNKVYAANARLLRGILGAIQQDAIRSEAANRLSSWAGDHKKETAGAIIYYKWVYNILKLCMEDELGERLFSQYMGTHFMKTSYRQLIEYQGADWWDNVHTFIKKEDRTLIVKQAWELTMDELISQLGKDLSKWTWKRVHTLEHVHPLGDRFPFNMLFNVGPFFIPGGNETINNTGFNLNKNGVYKVYFGPAMRRIIDFAEPSGSVSVLPTGQSGYFLAPHYDDQAGLFHSNSFRPQLMDKSDIISVSPGPLRLSPLKN